MAELLLEGGQDGMSVPPELYFIEAGFMGVWFLDALLHKGVFDHSSPAVHVFFILVH